MTRSITSIASITLVLAVAALATGCASAPRTSVAYGLTEKQAYTDQFCDGTKTANGRCNSWVIGDREMDREISQKSTPIGRMMARYEAKHKAEKMAKAMAAQHQVDSNYVAPVVGSNDQAVPAK